MVKLKLGRYKCDNCMFEAKSMRGIKTHTFIYMKKYKIFQGVEGGKTLINKMWIKLVL